MAQAIVCSIAKILKETVALLQLENALAEIFVLIYDITNELHQQRSSCACSNRNYPSSE